MSEKNILTRDSSLFSVCLKITISCVVFLGNNLSKKNVLTYTGYRLPCSTFNVIKIYGLLIGLSFNRYWPVITTFNAFNGLGFKIRNRIHFLMMKIIVILNSIVLMDE